MCGNSLNCKLYTYIKKIANNTLRKVGDVQAFLCQGYSVIYVVLFLHFLGLKDQRTVGTFFKQTFTNHVMKSFFTVDESNK